MLHSLLLGAQKTEVLVHFTIGHRRLDNPVPLIAR